MKVFNESFDGKLNSDLYDFLFKTRELRNFSPDRYLDLKTEKINKYFLYNGLSGAVIGISGGIDSALVLEILRRAKTVKKILPLFAPVSTKGMTNQSDAKDKVSLLEKSTGEKVYFTDLTDSCQHIESVLKQETDLDGDDWASGQLVSYIRTPLFYYGTSLLSANGFPAIVAGTVNRDEGSYLGYMSKPSDAMVDIQIISDLHKSEVKKLAIYLSLPEEIINATPRGDVYDQRSDEEIFGTPYDFVEIYLSFLCLASEEQEDIFSSWNNDAQNQFRELQKRLERLHSYNAHKYTVGSPAIHLNVLKSSIPGGWS